MHGLVATLAQEHLVDVGLQDAALAVVRLDQHRQQRLVELAHQVLPARQEQVAHQLLGQGGAALHHLAGAQVGPHGTRDGREVDAEVVLEITVLDRLQAGHQKTGHLVELHDAALFLLGAVERGDARRVQVGHRHRPAVAGLVQRHDHVARQRQPDAVRQLAAVGAGIATRGNHEVVATAGPGARLARPRGAGVAGKAQLKLERIGVHRLADLQRQRTRVDTRGHGEHQVVEPRLHTGIEDQRVRQQEAETEAQSDPERDAHQTPQGADRAATSRGLGQGGFHRADTWLQVYGSRRPRA